MTCLQKVGKSEYQKKQTSWLSVFTDSWSLPAPWNIEDQRSLSGSISSI